MHSQKIAPRAKSLSCHSYAKNAGVVYPQVPNWNTQQTLGTSGGFVAASSARHRLYPQSRSENVRQLAELAGSRTQRRSPGQRPWAHAESRAEWRRHIAQHVPAAGTTAVIADRSGGIRAQPVTAQVACRIDALNGEAGQILHRFPPRPRPWRGPPSQLKTNVGALLSVVSRENPTRYRGAVAKVKNVVEMYRARVLLRRCRA